MAIKISGDTVIYNDKVFRPAQMTAVQRDAISSPVEGMLIFNTDDNTVEVYSGTAWTALISASDVSSPQAYSAY